MQFQSDQDDITGDGNGVRPKVFGRSNGEGIGLAETIRKSEIELDGAANNVGG